MKLRAVAILVNEGFLTMCSEQGFVVIVTARAYHRMAY